MHEHSLPVGDRDDNEEWTAFDIAQDIMDWNAKCASWSHIDIYNPGHAHMAPHQKESVIQHLEALF